MRNYIHVYDLEDAHIKAVEYLENNQSDIFNVDHEKGYYVKKMLETIQKVTGFSFAVDNVQLRVGDTAELVPDNTKIKTKMNWIPRYEYLLLVCHSAFVWE